MPGNGGPKRATGLRLRIALWATLAGLSAPAFASDDAGLAPPAKRVIELIEQTAPGDAVIGAQPRRHHALSIATDAPKPLLRSLGVEASDCSVRLRVPSRVVPTHTGSGGARLQIQAQAGLACRY